MSQRQSPSRLSGVRRRSRSAVEFASTSVDDVYDDDSIGRTGCGSFTANSSSSSSASPKRHPLTRSRLRVTESSAMGRRSSRATSDTRVSLSFSTLEHSLSLKQHCRADSEQNPTAARGGPSLIDGPRTSGRNGATMAGHLTESGVLKVSSMVRMRCAAYADAVDGFRRKALEEKHGLLQTMAASLLPCGLPVGSGVMWEVEIVAQALLVESCSSLRRSIFQMLADLAEDGDNSDASDDWLSIEGGFAKSPGQSLHAPDATSAPGEPMRYFSLSASRAQRKAERERQRIAQQRKIRRRINREKRIMYKERLERYQAAPPGYWADVTTTESVTTSTNKSASAAEASLLVSSPERTEMTSSSVELEARMRAYQTRMPGVGGQAAPWDTPLSTVMDGGCRRSVSCGSSEHAAALPLGGLHRSLASTSASVSPTTAPGDLMLAPFIDGICLLPQLTTHSTEWHQQQLEQRRSFTPPSSNEVPDVALSVCGSGLTRKRSGLANHDERYSTSPSSADIDMAMAGSWRCPREATHPFDEKMSSGSAAAEQRRPSLADSGDGSTGQHTDLPLRSLPQWQSYEAAVAVAGNAGKSPGVCPVVISLHPSATSCSALEAPGASTRSEVGKLQFSEPQRMWEPLAFTSEVSHKQAAVGEAPVEIETHKAVGSIDTALAELDGPFTSSTEVLGGHGKLALESIHVAINGHVGCTDTAARETGLGHCDDSTEGKSLLDDRTVVSGRLHVAGDTNPKEEEGAAACDEVNAGRDAQAAAGGELLSSESGGCRATQTCAQGLSDRVEAVGAGQICNMMYTEPNERGAEPAWTGMLSVKPACDGLRFASDEPVPWNAEEGAESAAGRDLGYAAADLRPTEDGGAGIDDFAVEDADAMSDDPGDGVFTDLGDGTAPGSSGWESDARASATAESAGRDAEVRRDELSRSDVRNSFDAAWMRSTPADSLDEVHADPTRPTLSTMGGEWGILSCGDVRGGHMEHLLSASTSPCPLGAVSEADEYVSDTEGAGRTAIPGAAALSALDHVKPTTASTAAESSSYRNGHRRSGAAGAAHDSMMSSSHVTGSNRSFGIHLSGIDTEGLSSQPSLFDINQRATTVPRSSSGGSAPSTDARTSPSVRLAGEMLGSVESEGEGPPAAAPEEPRIGCPVVPLQVQRGSVHPGECLRTSALSCAESLLPFDGPAEPPMHHAGSVAGPEGRDAVRRPVSWSVPTGELRGSSRGPSATPGASGPGSLETRRRAAGARPAGIGDGEVARPAHWNRLRETLRRFELRHRRIIALRERQLRSACLQFQRMEFNRLCLQQLRQLPEARQCERPACAAKITEPRRTLRGSAGHASHAGSRSCGQSRSRGATTDAATRSSRGRSCASAVAAQLVGAPRDSNLAGGVSVAPTPRTCPATRPSSINTTPTHYQLLQATLKTGGGEAGLAVCHTDPSAVAAGPDTARGSVRVVCGAATAPGALVAEGDGEAGQRPPPPTQAAQPGGSEQEIHGSSGRRAHELSLALQSLRVAVAEGDAESPPHPHWLRGRSISTARRGRATDTSVGGAPVPRHMLHPDQVLSSNRAAGLPQRKSLACSGIPSHQKATVSFLEQAVPRFQVSYVHSLSPRQRRSTSYRRKCEDGVCESLQLV